MVMGIVLVEGADGSGKSTLVKELMERHDAWLTHGRVWPDMRDQHGRMIDHAQRLVDAGELVVIDRHWISELIYGPIFRGGAAYSNVTAEEFDEVIRWAPGVYVLCVPMDMKRHLARFERLKVERHEEFDRIEAVVQRYRDLLQGNVAHPGGNTVDLAIRFQDFTRDRRVVHYDLDVDGGRLDVVCDRIVRELRA